jgi:hypothetical protein
VPVELPPGVRHGDPVAYVKHKCGCDVCRRWNAERPQRRVGAGQ